MQGFFSSSDLSKQVSTSTASLCGSCGLSKCSDTGKMQVRGKGLRKILVVTEYPTKKEAGTGKHMAGDSGNLLDGVFDDLNFELLRDCWCTSALLCKPKQREKKQIAYCRYNLINTIKELKPKVVVLLGEFAITSLIGYLWKGDIGESNRWTNFAIPCKEFNCWIVCAYSIQHVLQENKKIVNLTFAGQLKLIKQKARPFETTPDYLSCVEPLYNKKQIIAKITDIIKSSDIAAFDYETTCLKPEYEKAEIVSASIATEHDTIAFPFYPEITPTFIEFLKSPVAKVASNLKFEDRWGRKQLKTFTRRWFWDTMIASHVLDNKPGITSIKFQAFVLLGELDYASHIKPYLESKGDSKYNRIKELSLKDLLLYNGLDSKYEFMVMKKQVALLGGEI